MGEFSLWHWIVVAIVFLALFGYKKLPDAARSIGRSMRVFKAEMRGMREDEQHDPARPAQQRLVMEGQVLQPGPTLSGGTADHPGGTASPSASPSASAAPPAGPAGVDAQPPRGE